MIDQQQMPSTGCLLGPNEVLVVDEVLTAEEQAVLVRWADDQQRSGQLLENPQDRGGYLTPYQSAAGARTRFTKDGPGPSADRPQEFVWIPRVDGRPCDPLPDAFWRIRARVVEWLQLHGLEEDHYKGSFLSYMAPGGCVHRHCDAKVTIDGERCEVLRCNVLFKRPDDGGLPVIGDTTLDVPDRGMWAFFPTELFHSATEVGGSAFRGTLSFGFLVRPADLWARRFRLADAVRSQYALDSEVQRRALVDLLRQSPDAATLADERFALVAYIVMAADDFTVRAAADALGRPTAEICTTLIDLQRSGFVDSVSSVSSQRGTVMVL